MSISAIEVVGPVALDVRVTKDEIRVNLADGRTVFVPLAWYPRLVHASQDERNQWRLIGHGTGIHWAALDEDVSIEGLLAGRPSGESQQSLSRWLEARGNTPTPRRARKLGKKSRRS